MTANSSTVRPSGAPKPMTRPENHDKIVAMLSDSPRGSLLDAPCGEGALSIRLKQMGFDVTCCDIDPDLFKVEDLSVQYGELNLGKLPYEDASFDYVVSANGLHRLWNPANALKEYSRVLKPGGTLICSFPNYAHISRRLRFLFSGGIARNVSKLNVQQVTDDPAAHYRTSLLFAQVKHLMGRYGLSIVSLESARRKRSGFAHYPLALLIRLLSLFATKRDRDAFCTEQSNSRAILLGSNHLFIRARKA